MYVYAGIDEAGYGPLLGPMVVGRSVFTVPKLDAGGAPPKLWQRLSKAVCRNLAERKGRIAVNDSKKLRTAAAGIRHLEVGCLAFAALADLKPATVHAWLTGLGEQCHEDLTALPWYAPCEGRPWQALPCCATAGEIAVARGLLGSTAKRIGVEVAELGACVVFEDQFNQMVRTTRSKAAVNFTFVAKHLRHIWQTHGQHSPLVAVDRQSGRMRYRELLAMNFPDADMQVLEESPQRSAYRLQGAGRAMTVTFEVEAESAHMPVALASMVSKYTRELMMARLNAYFRHQLAEPVAPTAGYATDGKRFLDQVRPHLPALGIEPHRLCRIA